MQRVLHESRAQASRIKGTHVGLARTAADLGKEQVDTEWRVLVDKVILNSFNLYGVRGTHAVVA